jgi:AbrB family looped-hinge helix DNA binding protein
MGEQMTEVVVTRMSSKGQIVVPLAIRKLLKLKVGEFFALVGEDDTIILKKIKIPSEDDFKMVMKWGKKYAKRMKISKQDVLDAIEAYRANN